MKQITPYRLWIGNVNACTDLALLSDTNIEYVVQLSVEELAPNLPRDVGLLRIPLLDGCGNDQFNLRFAITNVADLIKSKRRVLICCSAGLSRSPAIAACAIALAEKQLPDECLAMLADTLRTDISPGFWKDLLCAHGALTGR